MFSILEFIEFSITFILHFVIPISFFVTWKSTSTKGNEASRIDGAVDGTTGTSKDDGANKTNNPNTLDHGTAPVSNKQSFPFWNLLNVQVLLPYIIYSSIPFLFCDIGKYQHCQ